MKRCSLPRVDTVKNLVEEEIVSVAACAVVVGGDIFHGNAMRDRIGREFDARGIPVHVDAVEPIPPNHDILDHVSAAVVPQLHAVPIAGPCCIAEVVEAVFERPTVYPRSRRSGLPRSRNRRPNFPTTCRR